MFLAIDERGVIHGFSKYHTNFGKEYMQQETAAIKKTPADAFDERGIPCYRYGKESDKVIRRTQSEIDADYTEHEAAPTPEQRIAELEKALELLLSGVTE